MGRNPHIRTTARRRTQLVLVVLVAVVAAVVAIAFRDGNSKTGGAQAQASLVGLDPVLPTLNRHELVTVSHPDCEVNPPCTSAARTWTSITGTTTFADLNRALPAWTKHNHLHGSVQWYCGINGGLFGSTGLGCDASFAGPRTHQSTFVAATFINQSPSMYGMTVAHPNGPPEPLAVLGDRPLASLSLLVVGDHK